MRRGTYSIVAHDPETGEVGVAVQSHWFSVGSVVSWARPGVGAVATQSVAEPAHGPHVLDALARGKDPAGALAAVLARDELARVRQVGVVDAAGRVAVHTGPGCIAEAAHRTGAGYSCQANMMARDGVPSAMAGAYEAASGDLAARLCTALRAAEGAGGDVRGRQSAALVVAPASGEPWRLRFDLRVEDHPDPLDELERLLRLARAYEVASQGDELAGQGEHRLAADMYERAAGLAPEAGELRFWAGLGLAAIDLEAGARAVARVAEQSPVWLDLLDRLDEDLAPTAAAVRRALGRSPDR